MGRRRRRIAKKRRVDENEISKHSLNSESSDDKSGDEEVKVKEKSEESLEEGFARKRRLDEYEDDPKWIYAYSDDEEEEGGMSKSFKERLARIKERKKEFQEKPLEDRFDDIKDAEIRQQYINYFQKLEDSQGFDIDPVPTKGPRMSDFIFPLHLDQLSAFTKTKGCTEYAIQQYNNFNKGKSMLKLEEIVKANVCTVFYYITFRATDQFSRLTLTYQAEVFYIPAAKHMDLLLFRIKGKKKGMLFSVDFNDLEDYERIKKCANHAITRHNKEEEKRTKCKLELVKVVSAAFRAAFRETSVRHAYCITLEARDVESDQTGLYITKVLCHTKIGYMKKLLFRPKGEGKVRWSDDDEDDDYE